MGFAGFVSHPVSKPVIAAVVGQALGGGTELALACDLVVAAPTSSFGLPEVKRGLIAAAGGVFRLPQQVPRKIAMQVMLTGLPMPAADALRWGLVNELADDPLARARELAAQICVNAPLAVQATKRLATTTDETALWERNTEEMTRLAQSSDLQEGLAAFAQKRPPVWTGR